MLILVVMVIRLIYILWIPSLITRIYYYVFDAKFNIQIKKERLVLK